MLARLGVHGAMPPSKPPFTTSSRQPISGVAVGVGVISVVGVAVAVVVAVGVAVAVAAGMVHQAALF